MFLHVSVCPQGVVSRPIPGGGGGWGVWLGGSPGPYPGGVGGSDLGGLQAHTQGEVGGSGREGGFPGPGLGGPGSGPGGCPGPGSGGAPGPGVCVCVCMYPSMHMETPPSRWLLLWTVRILLECILVLDVI